MRRLPCFLSYPNQTRASGFHSCLAHGQITFHSFPEFILFDLTSAVGLSRTKASLVDIRGMYERFRRVSFVGSLEGFARTMPLSGVAATSLAHSCGW